VRLHHIGARDEHQRGVVDVVVDAHRLVLPERRDVAGHCRGHAEPRVALDVVGADARLEELVGRVALLGQELAGAIEADRFRSALGDGPLEALCRRVQRVVPGGLHQPSVVADHGVQGAVADVEDVAVHQPLDAEAAAVPATLQPLDLDDPALLDAHGHLAAGAAEAADGLLPPVHRDCVLTRQGLGAAGQVAGRGEAARRTEEAKQITSCHLQKRRSHKSFWKNFRPPSP
jgi:hypothetical protein